LSSLITAYDWYISLPPEGVTPRPDAVKPEYLRLGQTTIRPLGPNDGRYIRADSRGYQFLVNFKKYPAPFPTCSLSALFSSQIHPEAIQDKIVLIGTHTEAV
jgi:adenylate cyclase